jgi:hypothetical protein
VVGSGKKTVPAPIDRPLSRAYLREFSGWSTAFAPGLSEPTSLRIMENALVTRNGALQIRPALRSVFPDGNWLTTNFAARIIGSFESFFMNDGSKALLFATKESNGTVTFKVAGYDSASAHYHVMTLEEAGFTGTTSFTSGTMYVRYLQIDNKIFALPDSKNINDNIRIFYVGAEKKVVKPKEITSPTWDPAHALQVLLPEAAWINTAVKTTIPTAETSTSGTANQPLTGTLIDLELADNTFNFGYYYTFQNDFGETPPSQLTVIKAKRGWSQWQFETAAAAGGPSGTGTSDPTMACDQIVATIPSAAWNDAIGDGATAWNLYMIAWSDQGAVPVEGTLIASKDLTVAGITRAKDGWLQHTPVAASYDITMPLPTPDDRVNYSKPSSASQGLVAGDRITLVNDRQAPALIRWSSNQLGEYTNFSPSKGGGFKTLTSGNLLVPACVKLWQNPQSTDTLVVLCRGVDGYSTSYYMAPAEVSGQTGSTSIMGFEETTATPGTVSPWGVEVANQALFHPLDEQLMKSTASNYNINHKSMTDKISNVWLELVLKQNIVSAQLDSRLYYIVNNPDGVKLETGCMGNEIWVCDTGAGTDVTWSRWLIQANSLHKLEVGNKLYMAVVRPEAIFVLDELEFQDEYAAVDGTTAYRAIPWKIETNTQGANRAHDAWAHLQQVSISMGNFMGRLRFGIRGWDQHGKAVEVSKITKDLRPVDLHARPLPWDLDDILLVRRDLKEWSLFAESVEENGVVATSYGRINLVQYRYSPVSVNVGYEHGSVETFEYQRASSPLDPTTNYPNGVALPYIDTTR